MRTRIQLLTTSLALLLLTGCDASTLPLPVEEVERLELERGVPGTVRWYGIEGGFWAVQLQDGRVLDPHASLPADFRADGLRVTVEARLLRDVACIHMVGSIVEITRITRRP